MTYEHEFAGLTPGDLAGYLAALGCIRLVAEQKDPNVTGFWLNEKFTVATELSEAELVEFFVDEYSPTPAITPVNGSNGFWPKDAKMKCNAHVDAIRASADARFAEYRKNIEIFADYVATKGYNKAPDDDPVKIRVLGDVRGLLTDLACQWLDASAIVAGDKRLLPPFTGSGGNDGRLNFSTSFMERLLDIDNNRTESAELLRACLFAEPTALLSGGTMGQFLPGAGGINAGGKFEIGAGDAKMNPWSYILLIEGALLLTASAGRRHGSSGRKILTVPFITGTAGSGSGAVSILDEDNDQKPRGEFWAPLWNRKLNYAELRSVMSEGRAAVGGREALNGLDFARAAKSFGTARGIGSFQRFSFLRRRGDSYNAMPIGRVEVSTEETAGAVLVAEIDAWIRSVRNCARDKNVSQTWREIGRDLDEAVFELIDDCSNETVQRMLVLIGRIAAEVGKRIKVDGRKTDRRELWDIIKPPPELGEKWIAAADDGSDEFNVAAALAGLYANGTGKDGEPATLTLRQYIVPVVRKRGRWEWQLAGAARNLAVWTGRDAEQDMIAALMRGLLEADRANYDGMPLGSGRTAPLSAVVRFLTDEGFDMKLMGDLAAGLAWASKSLKDTQWRGSSREDVIPLAYASLKPVFVKNIRELPGGGKWNRTDKLHNPQLAAGMIRAGDLDRGIEAAQRMLQAIRIPMPYAGRNVGGGINTRRLLAAMLIPVAKGGIGMLMKRAYSLPEPEVVDENR